MVYTVGQKGQIVVAKEIRERLGVKPGWVALQRLVEDRVEVYFLPPEHRGSLKGSLAEHLKAGVSSGKAWDEARKAAWREAAASRESVKEQES